MAMYEFNPDDADRFAMQIGIPVRRHGRELIFKKCPYCGAYSKDKEKFCEQCYARGVLVPVEEIHHKIPLAKGGSHDRSNLIALCKSCHSQIHAKRGDRWHDR